MATVDASSLSSFAMNLLMSTGLTALSVSKGGKSLPAALASLVGETGSDAVIAGIMNPAVASVVGLGCDLFDPSAKVKPSGVDVVSDLAGGFAAAKIGENSGLTGSQSWYLSAGISHMSRSALYAAQEAGQMLKIAESSNVDGVTRQPSEFMSLLKSRGESLAMDGLLTAFKTMLP